MSNAEVGESSQEVCPWNVRFSDEGSRTSTDSAESPGRSDANTGPSPTRPPTHPGTDGPSLVELLRTALSEEAWEAFSRGSAIRRAGRAGFGRSGCVAIGNWMGESDDPEPVAVRLFARALSDPR